MDNLNLEKIAWNYISSPACANGDLVLLVQNGEAEIAKFVSPKPKGAPEDNSDFVFEILDNSNRIAKQALTVIKESFPEIHIDATNPVLFKIIGGVDDETCIDHAEARTTLKNTP